MTVMAYVPIEEIDKIQVGTEAEAIVNESTRFKVRVKLIGTQITELPEPAEQFVEDLQGYAGSLRALRTQQAATLGIGGSGPDKDTHLQSCKRKQSGRIDKPSRP